MTTLLLSLVLSGPPAYYHKPRPRAQPTWRQAMTRRKVNDLVRHLKRQDPRVLHGVMKKMGWAFRKTPAEACKKKGRDQMRAIDEWELRMLCELGGIPCFKK